MILDFVFLTITYAGGYLVVTIVATLSILSFWMHKHENRIAPFLAAILGSAGTVWSLKNILEIPRPEGALYLESTHSFPSGHAALAMALYGFLFITIWRHEKHRLQNKSLILLSLLIITIGTSRIYLGVHYLTDILAGYVIGLGWLLFAFATPKLWRLQGRKRRG